jgi:RNA polymerase sigma-70 factor (ECF subfamily)
MDEPVDAWFAREILAHEEALVRYLRRCWPQADDILDLRQETYIRVYEAARRARPNAWTRCRGSCGTTTATC